MNTKLPLMHVNENKEDIANLFIKGILMSTSNNNICDIFVFFLILSDWLPKHVSGVCQ